MGKCTEDYAKITATLSASITGLIESQKMVIELMCKDLGHDKKVSDYLFSKTILEVFKNFKDDLGLEYD